MLKKIAIFFIAIFLTLVKVGSSNNIIFFLAITACHKPEDSCPITIFELLINELINLRKVKISSFGTFKVMSKGERIGRNPKTKIEAKISSRKVVKFKPSIFIKKKINKNEK